MTTILSVLCLSALGLPPALAAGDPPPDDPPPDERPSASIPANSYLCVEFAGLARCRDAADAMALVGIVESLAERLGPHLGIGRPDDAMRDELPAVDRDLEAVGLTRKALRELLQGPLALGVSRPTFFGDEAVPSIALVIDVGQRQRSAERTLGAVHRALLGAGPSMQLREETWSGAEVTIIHPERHNGAVASAIVGSQLLFTNSPGYLRDCLSTRAGEAPGIDGAAALRRGRERLGDHALLTAFANTRPLTSWVHNVLPYEADPVLDALGVNGFDGAFVGVGASAHGSHGVIDVGVKTTGQGLMASLFGGRVAEGAARAARYCPPDTLLFASAALDLEGLAQGGEALLRALPPEARHEVQRELHREIGRELQRELDDAAEPVHRLLRRLASRCGPEFTFAVSTPGIRSMIPSVCAFLAVRGADPDLAGAIANDLAAAGVELEVTHADDVDIHYARVRHGHDAPMRMTPAFAQHEGTLIVASDVRALKSALASASGKKPSLAGQQSFAELLRAHGDASLLCSMRLQDNLGTMWRSWVPMLENLVDGHPEWEVTSDDIPKEEAVRAALGDVVLTVRGDREAIAIQTRSPIGLGAVLAALGKYGDELLGLEPRPKKKIY